MPAYEYTTAAISHGLMGRKAEEVDREEQSPARPEPLRDQLDRLLALGASHMG